MMLRTRNSAGMCIPDQIANPTRSPMFSQRRTTAGTSGICRRRRASREIHLDVAAMKQAERSGTPVFGLSIFVSQPSDVGNQEPTKDCTKYRKKFVFYLCPLYFEESQEMIATLLHEGRADFWLEVLVEVCHNQTQASFVSVLIVPELAQPKVELIGFKDLFGLGA